VIKALDSTYSSSPLFQIHGFSARLQIDVDKTSKRGTDSFALLPTRACVQLKAVWGEVRRVIHEVQVDATTIELEYGIYSKKNRCSQTLSSALKSKSWSSSNRKVSEQDIPSSPSFIMTTLGSSPSSSSWPGTKGARSPTMI